MKAKPITEDTAVVEGDVRSEGTEEGEPRGLGELPIPSFEGDETWLGLARDLYSESKDWFDSSVRKRVEDAMARFNSRHPAGSKYTSDLAQKRSHVFHPKTRSAMRRQEAAMAVAFFSTADAVDVSPVDDDNEDQRDAADLAAALLNYRLVTQSSIGEGGIPWFLTCIGGAQDALNTGVVISKQEWIYERRTRTYRDGSSEDLVVFDQPSVELIPIENLRLSPSAKWYDPIRTSAYVIELVPMYAGEVKRRMVALNPRTGESQWRPLPEGALRAATREEWDTIRQARERIGNAQGILDRYEELGAVDDYNVVWVHRHIVRLEDGHDYCFDTLGQELMLSWEPVPIEEVYLHCKRGMRPYAMGFSVVEAHKLYPQGPNDLMAQLQDAINDLANLRLDNLKLAINKRFLVRRGSGIDIRALMRNVAGGVSYVQNVNTDVKEMDYKDVTGSSYQEYDRMNLEADEIGGVMSQSTVGSSRRLSDTLGGMNLLASDASEVKEYTVRTFAESWVEQVMRQLVALEGVYEHDRAVLEMVGARQQMDLKRVLQVLGKHPVAVSCNVGFGATNPVRRIEKLAIGMRAIAEIAPSAMAGVDQNEIVKIVMGALGFKHGERLFPSLFKRGAEDPRVASLMQQVQQLQAMVQGKQMELQSRERIAAGTNQSRERIAFMQAQLQFQIEGMKARLEELDLQIKAAETDLKKRELWMEREALSHEIMQKEREFKTQQQEIAMGQGRKRFDDEDSGPPPIGGGRDKAGMLARGNFGMMPNSLATPPPGPLGGG